MSHFRLAQGTQGPFQGLPVTTLGRTLAARDCSPYFVFSSWGSRNPIRHVLVDKLLDPLGKD